MAETEARRIVRLHLSKLLGIAPEAVKFDRGLEGYGLDSVDAVLMAGALEETLGVEIDPATFLQHPTLEAMIRALETQLALTRAASGAGA